MDGWNARLLLLLLLSLRLKSSSATSASWILKGSNKGLDRNTVTPASQTAVARSQTDSVNFLNWKFNYSQQNPALWPVSGVYYFVGQIQIGD